MNKSARKHNCALATHPQPKAVRILVAMERATGAGLVAAMFGLVLTQIVSRYGFGRPLVWTEELARFSLVWLTFVGAALVMARRRHIVVQVRRLGDRAWLASEIISTIAVVAACIAALPAGIDFVVANMPVRSPAAGVPIGWVKSAGLVGLTLIAFHASINLWVAVRHGRAIVEAESADQVVTAV